MPANHPSPAERAARRWPGALGGAVWGLALARFLFESQPQALGLFNTWPGALGGAALGAALGGYTLARLRLPPASATALYLPLLSLLTPEVNLLRAFTLLAGSALLFVALAHEKRRGGDNDREKRLAEFSLYLYLFLFLLYLSTLGRTVGEADPFEFQVTAARLGIAHGSGYPLLMLLGKLFTLLPVGGSLAFRANLTSAFFAGLAAVGVLRLTRRLGASPLTALLAGLAFGVSPTLWARATEIEAYTLHAAILVGLLNLAADLVAFRSSTQQLPATTIYLTAFLFGLGLTNHLTTLLAAPAVGLGVLAAYGHWLAGRGAEQAALFKLARVSLAALAFLVLGYALYLYVPLRWPAVNGGEVMSLEKFVWVLRGGQSTGEFNPALAWTDGVRYVSLFRKITGQYTWPGFALAVFGALALAFRRDPSGNARWFLTLLLVTYAANVFFVMAYNTRDPDWSDFFIPLHLSAAVLMGVGLQAIHNTQNRLRNAEVRPWASCLLTSVFCILPLRSLWTTFPQVDRSGDNPALRLAQFALRQPLDYKAAILADPAHFAPLYYLQSAEGLRPDLDLSLLPDEASYRAALEGRLAAGQTVYLARYLPGLGAAYSLRSVGPLAQVAAQPFITPPAISRSLSATLVPNIHLLGYDLVDSHLTLYWRADAAAGDNYLVYLRLVDSGGAVAWESAGRVPVNGLYPVNAWRAGETVSDFHQIETDASLAPGSYQLEVGLFPPFHPSAAEGWLTVSPLAVPAATDSPTPAHRVRAQFGPNWLVGYAAPESAAPGSNVEVTLYWLRAVSSTSVSAFGDTRSIAAWPVGAVAPLKYRLAAPAASRAVPLVIGGPARCGWLAPVTESCALGAIKLEGAAVAPGAVNFDNRLVLRRATLGAATAAPGDTVQVTLEWQALQSVPADYTVFVHLVGPDGLLYGQVDYYPVQGTLPTSQWKPGQVIRDPYSVRLASDAPPGEYTVHIGMYLLATLERLPVLGAVGQPVDDKSILAGLKVP